VSWLSLWHQRLLLLLVFNSILRILKKKNFEEQFLDDAHKVLEAVGSSLYLTLGAIDALVDSMISFAHYTNQTWPFVTIPDFAVRSAKIRSLSTG